MQVFGFIQQTFITILLDSRSAHCFLDTSLAARLGLHLHPWMALSVIFVNGWRFLRGIFYCQPRRVWCGLRRELAQNFWHYTLGLMIMKFFKNGTVIEVCGLASSLLLLESDHTHRLQQLLDCFANIFEEPICLFLACLLCHKIILEQGKIQFDPLSPSFFTKEWYWESMSRYGG